MSHKLEGVLKSLLAIAEHCWVHGSTEEVSQWIIDNVAINVAISVTEALSDACRYSHRQSWSVYLNECRDPQRIKALALEARERFLTRQNTFTKGSPTRL